jgi:hypothetical protein
MLLYTGEMSPRCTGGFRSKAQAVLDSSVFGGRCSGWRRRMDGSDVAGAHREAACSVVSSWVLWGFCICRKVYVTGTRHEESWGLVGPRLLAFSGARYSDSPQETEHLFFINCVRTEP